MNNKEKIELSKEELLILIDGIDYLNDMECVSFNEWNVSYQELRKKLSDVFYGLRFKD